MLERWKPHLVKWQKGWQVAPACSEDNRTIRSNLVWKVENTRRNWGVIQWDSDVKCLSDCNWKLLGWFRDQTVWALSCVYGIHGKNGNNVRLKCCTVILLCFFFCTGSSRSALEEMCARSTGGWGRRRSCILSPRWRVWWGKLLYMHFAGFPVTAVWLVTCHCHSRTL